MKSLFLISLAVILLVLPGVFAITLDIISPEESETYPSRIVLLSLEADEESTFYYMINGDGSGRWIKLCSNTMTCTRNLRVSEGDNSFAFKAVNSLGDSSPGTRNFEVDSKKPRILRISPSSNSIIGSLFSIRYTEDNLPEIKLRYGNEIGGYDNEVTLGGCVNGTNEECNASVNLDSYDGQLIDFWFIISDGTNEVLSRRTRVKVDTSKPIIEDYQIISDGTKVKFIVDIDENEANFKDISYEDKNDCSTNFVSLGRLCNNLIAGRCIATRSFCRGNHQVKIIARDKAGNSVETASEDLNIV